MLTRRADKRHGAALVRRAIRHGLVPEFRKGAPLDGQTAATRWALHLLAIMSLDSPADIMAVKDILAQTGDIQQEMSPERHRQASTQHEASKEA